MTIINLQEIYGHGMMMDPVNRSSAWRKGFPVKPNYTDNEHFCGGRTVCIICKTKNLIACFFK